MADHGRAVVGRAPARPTTAVSSRHAPRRGWWTVRRRDQLTGYLFIAPQLIGSAVFVFMPLGLVIWYSLHEWNVLADTFTFAGADNYRQLVDDPNLPTVLQATALFSFGLVVSNLVLALLLAELLNARLRYTVLFRALFFSPVVVSLVAWTIVWGFLLQDNGGINALLRLVGVGGPNWLRGDATALISVIATQLFKGVGLNVVLFLAALQGVPEELHDAATVDGAGRWARYRRITIPMISPTILLATILTVIGSLQAFAQIVVLTQGGPGNATTVLVYYLYQQAFQFHHFGYGATLSMLLFCIVLVLTLLQWRLRRRWVFYEQ